MNKQGSYILSISTKMSSPFIKIPKLPLEEIRVSSPKKVITHEFFVVADGKKRIFSEQDAVDGYGQQSIHDPKDYSYVNLFINGVLQPKINYEVKKGKLILKTDDFPLLGTPIILQMVRIY
ncbi:DUF4183 domain-containing protein [Cytobacillus sp. Hz8]|uniref:DUF4183 domain-containing protein n=1 Tax=Cytobacillus sp. Hz8 TaxID=3347168 RepID=UPI0035E143AD